MNGEVENGKNALCDDEDSSASSGVHELSEDTGVKMKDDGVYDFDEGRKSMNSGEMIEDVEKEFEFDQTQDFPNPPLNP